MEFDSPGGADELAEILIGIVRSEKMVSTRGLARPSGALAIAGYGVECPRIENMSGQPLKMPLPVIAAAFLTAATVAQGQPLKPGPKIAPPPLVGGGVAASDSKLAAAAASTARPAVDRARDAARHPLETLEFWGVRPGTTVVDLEPGAGYWTWILADYAKASGGRYIAAGSERGRAGFFKRFATAPFGPPTYTVFDKSSPPFAPPGSVDLVISSREIHNWISEGALDKSLRDVATALKPGGVFAVEEHRADPRVQLADASNGYVATATVIGAARRAGLVLDASAEINANPRDTKDYPFGVWTLPPTRQSSADGKSPSPAGFDRARYDAIGESDRMTLRFRKPG